MRGSFVWISFPCALFSPVHFGGKPYGIGIVLVCIKSQVDDCNWEISFFKNFTSDIDQCSYMYVHISSIYTCIYTK